MNFSDALRHMNQGHWVRRQQWHAKQWIRVTRVRHRRDTMALGVSYLDYYLDDEGARWIPNVSDVTATDWMLGKEVDE